jgi:hypothetical protein
LLIWKVPLHIAAGNLHPESWYHILFCCHKRQLAVPWHNPGANKFATGCPHTSARSHLWSGLPVLQTATGSSHTWRIPNISIAI